MIKFCPRCGERNRGREPICPNCSQKLYGLLAGGVERITCLVCSTPNPATATFCTNCGRRHSDPLPENEPPPPLADLLPMPASSGVLVAGGASGGGGGPGRGVDVKVPPTVRAASGVAVARTVEMAPHHRMLGCAGAVVGAVVFVALFTLLFRQTQQALVAETAAPTPRSTEVAVAGQRAPDGVVVGGSGARSAAVTAPPRSAAVGSGGSSPSAKPGQTTDAGARQAIGSASGAVAGAGGAAGVVPSQQTATMRLQVDTVSVENSLGPQDAAAGRRLLVATITIENLSARPLPYDSSTAQLVASDGAAYRPMPGQGNTVGSGTLEAGRKVSGQLKFDVQQRRDLTFRFGGVDIDLSAALP